MLLLEPTEAGEEKKFKIVTEMGDGSREKEGAY